MTTQPPQDGTGPPAPRAKPAAEARPKTSGADPSTDFRRPASQGATKVQTATHWHRWCEGGPSLALGFVRAEVTARAQHRKARLDQRGLLPGRRRRRRRGLLPARGRGARALAGRRRPRPGGRGRARRPARRCWPAATRTATSSWCAARAAGGRARRASTSPSRRPSRSRCSTPSAIRPCRPGRSTPTRPPSARRSATWRSHAAFLRRGRAGAQRVPAARPGGRRLSPPRLARRRPGPAHPRAGGQHRPGRTRAASGPSTRGRSTATPRPPATSTRQSCATS